MFFQSVNFVQTLNFRYTILWEQLIFCGVAEVMKWVQKMSQSFKVVSTAKVKLI